MTLDEAIKHCEEVAENYRCQRDDAADINDVGAASDCQQCADDHEQLAKWLQELQEAKRLLKKAVSGFRYLGAEWMEHEDRCTLDCSVCPLYNGYNCSHWNMQAEALKLIGEDKE